MSNLGQMTSATAAHSLGCQAMELLRDIYPICRSITGDGVRTTLKHITKCVPVDVHEVPSGTKVLDWEVPLEWNVREAFVADERGTRVIDFARNNLHLVGYSAPVKRRVRLDELQRHLHSLPATPDRIPYRTAYYREDWGFCLADEDRGRLAPGDYDVCVDSTLRPGSLTYGEVLVKGELDDEILLSTHICHPSLANDNCSGIAVMAVLAGAIAQLRPRLSYRFVFVPVTIGAITWLARNRSAARKIRAGLVLCLLGDAGPLTYKRSRRSDAEIDRIAAATIQQMSPQSRVLPYSPYGYDERQYCSPAFNLPMGRLTRSTNGGYPEYHTSADNLDLISEDALSDSISAVVRILADIESSDRFISIAQEGEPRLGPRGLFRSVGGRDPTSFEHAVLWVLNQSDGEHGVTDIAIASGIERSVIVSAAEALQEAGLIRPLGRR
jgi:aminopeptidase-like protein